jgi:hypothetical protein
MSCRLSLVAAASIGIVTGIVLVSAPSAQQRQGAAEDLLQRRMGVSASEIRELRNGDAIVKTLSSGARQELAHLGVVAIDMPSERFIARFRDIERFERGPGIPLIGRFSDPPRIEDLAALSLPADDIEALRTCQPGDCDLKLSAEAMKRLRGQVNWASRDAARQANEAMRRLLLDLVLAYKAQGNSALGHYDDGTESLPIADEFRALLAQPAVVPVPINQLLDYVRDFPRNRPTGAEEFFYWCLVEFGLKPTIRLNHVVIYPLAGNPSNVAYAIATKQIYASHYFHTTLELRFLLNRSDPAANGFYLLSLVRSRNDGMTGFKGSLLRPIINRRSRTGVRRYLEYVKRQMEQ